VVVSKTKHIWRFYFAGDNETCVVLHVMCPIRTKFRLFLQIFIKTPNIKFYESPFSASRTDTCGKTDGRTDTTKLIGAFREFAKAPKNYSPYQTEPVEQSPTLRTNSRSVNQEMPLLLCNPKIHCPFPKSTSLVSLLYPHLCLNYIRMPLWGPH
jgi:hypothetical protein